MPCSCAHEAEYWFGMFLKSLGREEVKALVSGYEAEQRLDEESEEEMKDAVWVQVRRVIRWGAVLQRIKDEMGICDDEDDEETRPDGDGSDDE